MFIKKILLKRIIFVFLPLFIFCNPISLSANPGIVAVTQVITSVLGAVQSSIQIYKNFNSSSKEEDKESKKIEKDSSSNPKTKSNSDSNSNSDNPASNLFPLTKGGERPTISPSWFSSLENDIFKQAKLIKETTEKLKKANTKTDCLNGASEREKQTKELDKQIDTLKDMLSSPSKNVSQTYEKKVLKHNTIDEIEEIIDAGKETMLNSFFVFSPIQGGKRIYENTKAFFAAMCSDMRNPFWADTNVLTIFVTKAWAIKCKLLEENKI